MKQCRLDGKKIVLRAIAVSGLAAAFLLALVLSAAPELHERLHQPGDATHQCVVTLLTAGNCQHAPCDSIAVAQPPKQGSPTVPVRFQSVSARLGFSLLEHAPPVIS